MQSKTNSSSYNYKSKNGVVILVVIVDEVFMSSDSKSLPKDFEWEMKNLFQVKPMGEAKSFIRLDIQRERQGITFRQRNYIEKIIIYYGLFHCNCSKNGIRGIG